MDNLENTASGWPSQRLKDNWAWDGSCWMQKTAWIWFTGFAAWLIDAAVSLRYHNWLHARLALTVATFFLAAGIFYRFQQR
jgi:hypothetical protein